MHDTWAVRDLPVLDATIGLLENSHMVTVTDIAAETDFDPSVVAQALDALDPLYVDFRKTTTGGDPRYWYVYKVTPEARRAVGQWPTAEALASRLAEELSAAAGREGDSQHQSLLAYAARLIGDTLREATVRAAEAVLAPAFDGIPVPEIGRQVPRPEPRPDPEFASLVPLPELPELLRPARPDGQDLAAPATAQAENNPPPTPEQADSAPPAALESAEFAPPAALEPAEFAPPAAPEPAEFAPPAALESAEFAPPAAPEPAEFAPPAAPELAEFAPPAAPEPAEFAPPAALEPADYAPSPVPEPAPWGEMSEADTTAPGKSKADGPDLNFWFERPDVAAAQATEPDLAPEATGTPFRPSLARWPAVDADAVDADAGDVTHPDLVQARQDAV